MLYSGFLRRFGAFIIDIFVFLLLFALFAVLALMFEEAGGTPLTRFLTKKATIFAILVGWLYFAFMESSHFQATIGKLLLGMRVTDLEGKRIDFYRATLRFFARYISAFILMIGYLMVLFTSRKQALHDIISGSLVINYNRECCSMHEL